MPGAGALMVKFAITSWHHGQHVLLAVPVGSHLPHLGLGLLGASLVVELGLGQRALGLSRSISACRRTVGASNTACSLASRFSSRVRSMVRMSSRALERLRVESSIACSNTAWAF
jgi:hypothetical protein